MQAQNWYHLFASICVIFVIASFFFRYKQIEKSQNKFTKCAHLDTDTDTHIPQMKVKRQSYTLVFDIHSISMQNSGVHTPFSGKNKLSTPHLDYNLEWVSLSEWDWIGSVRSILKKKNQIHSHGALAIYLFGHIGCIVQPKTKSQISIDICSVLFLRIHLLPTAFRFASICVFWMWFS